MLKNRGLTSILGNFEIEGKIFTYKNFIARFVDFCTKEGLQLGKIVPSRAFCSDESQGYPAILISKHFGTFPFDHGLVGGRMAIKRHAPHAHHGDDLVILQASHVGYIPESKIFGEYRRLQTHDHTCSSNCGKINAALGWYMKLYQFAQNNIYLQRVGDDFLITIDKQLYKQSYKEGLFIHLDKLLRQESDGTFKAMKILSTSEVFHASDHFIAYLKEKNFKWSQRKMIAIGEYLTADLFHFERELDKVTDTESVQRNLYDYMPWIVTSDEPMLVAAQVNVQIEFEHSYRSIVHEEGYSNRNLVYIAGLNIDISPQEGQLFPLTLYVPWAAYIQHKDGSHFILEQNDLYKSLMECSNKNAYEVDLEKAIHQQKDSLPKDFV